MTLDARVCTTTGRERKIAECHAPGVRFVDNGAESPHDYWEVATANAHLIAAAPDMLEALEALLAEAGGLPKVCGHYYFCVCGPAKARAAIAKAKGTQ